MSIAPRRLVFLDVDGTIIDHHQHLAPSVTAAVRSARAVGHLVYICTGRARAEISPHILDIGFDGVVSAGGGFIERGGELVAERTMPAADVALLVDLFRRHGIEYMLQGYDDVYPSKGVAERLSTTYARIAAEDARAGRPVDVPDAGRLLPRLRYRGDAPAQGIAKATFFGDDPGTFRLVADHVPERFHVMSGTIPYLGEAGGEATLRGIDKGAAVADVVARHGQTPADAIAIGDSVNDLEMFQVAGLGIAMANASDAVKAHADEVTTAVDDDGVWNAFVRHGLV